MTSYSDFKSELRAWVGLQSPPDSVVDGWITMVETRVNREMRVGEMVERDFTTLSDSETVLPDDWLQTEFLRYLPSTGANQPDIRYGRPLHFKTYDNFYEACNDPDHPDHLKSFFTVVGLTLLINPMVGALDGTQLEIGYYSKVPPLKEVSENWLYNNYHDIYLYGALAHAGAFLTEDERVPLWETRATKGIQDANDAWQRAKTSGAPLRPRFRSFG